MRKRVSVIVTNYNYGRFLSECLDSIVRQTYKNYELIVVDDGSTDNSLEVINRYKLFIDKLIIFNCNRGVVTAGNVGIDASEGELCCFINADDYIEPDYISSCVETLDSNPSRAYAYTDFWHFGNGIDNGVTVADFSPEALRSWNMVLASAMFKKEVFKRVGGLEVKEGFEDYDLWLKMLSVGEEGIRVPGFLYRYRNHDDNRSRNINYADLGNQIKEKHGLKMPLQLLWKNYTSNPKFDPQWAISWETAEWMLGLIQSRRPKRILDLGSGFSTVVFQYYKQYYDPSVEVTSVDHDFKWLTGTSDFLTTHRMPLPIFKLNHHDLAQGAYDFVFVDYEHTWGLRKQLVEYFITRSSNGWIVFDDMHHPDYATEVMNVARKENLNLHKIQNTMDSFGRFAFLSSGKN